MRGRDERTRSLFSYVNLDGRVRKDHPLRAIRLLVNATLASMEREFTTLYAGIGRPSIAPESRCGRCCCKHSVGVDEEGSSRWIGPDDPAPPSGSRNAETDFRDETRSNATHASTTDPDAKLYREGPGMKARLAILDHALMENRNGLLVDACLVPAGGHAERLAAMAMIERGADRAPAVTLGADKEYDGTDFVNERRSMSVRSHLARNATCHCDEWLYDLDMPAMSQAKRSASASRRHC